MVQLTEAAKGQLRTKAALEAAVQAYEETAARYPKDDESQIFNALYIAGTQSQGDQSYASYLKAAGILAPILVGGESGAALRRVAKHGDGWIGMSHDFASGAAQIARIKVVGRSVSPVAKTSVIG